MLENLPDYIPLIQLLVGSVIISSIQIKRSDPYGEGRDDLRRTFQEALQGEDLRDYKIVNGESWKKTYSHMLTSMMVTLAIYGCIVLFYSANFQEDYSPSPLGVILLSVVTTIYQLYIIYSYGKKNIYSDKLSYLCIGLFVLFFLLFIILFPNLIVFSKTLTIVSNTWILINLLLWLVLMAKNYYMYYIARNKIYELSLKLRISNQIGIESRLQYILESIQQENEKTRKKILIQTAKSVLATDELYVSISYDPTTHTTTQQYNTLLPQKLHKIIANCKCLGSQEKKLLYKHINNEPHPKAGCPAWMDYVEEEKTKIFDQGLPELQQLGILEKK